ncbi:MAG: DUF1501 domain-containing protein [Kofleriaceae bacterium]
MLTRRQLLGALRFAAIAGAARPLLRAGTAIAAPRTRPRFYLQIIPQGGMDAVYTTDPKTTREVDKDIDVPFAAKDIVETSAMRLGPSFKMLRPWASRLAVVNAFRQNSANHSSGLLHVTRCKSTALAAEPSLLEILGTRREQIAAGSFNIGSTFGTSFSPKYFGTPSTAVFGSSPGLLEHLDAADPADLRTAAKALEREAAGLATARPTAAERTAADNLRESAAFLTRAAQSPRFAPVDWKHDLEPLYGGGKDLQRALWLFENRIARCVTVLVGFQDFDTHLWNTTVQPAMTTYLGALLGKLFGELDARSLDGAPLSSQVAVIVGSEIGRFPRLNAAHGKDHFPQVSQLFFGPWFAGGASYGATGRDMAAQPISLATGKLERGGHLLRVDDIGTTLLDLDGANPELYGYSGNHLGFLAP